MKLRILHFAAVVCYTAAAQQSSTELGGYLKYLLSSTVDSPQGTVTDHLLHARLNTKWYPYEGLSGVMELRFRGYYGGMVELTPQFAEQIKNRDGLSGTDATLWSTNKSLGYGELDRAYVNWAPQNFQATIGRQRIAWGTNLVWNVIDIFNPLSVLDFDYVERPAVDAIHLQYYTSAVTKLAVAYKPRTRYSKSITGFLWTINRWNYDFHIIGGERYGMNFGGLGWAGDIAGGGFRGETLVSEMPDLSTGGASNRSMVSAALSGDYTFRNSFYIHTEVLYNTEGVTSGASLYRPTAQKLGLLSPARWSLFQELSYDISPLVRGSCFAIINPIDHSVALVPSIAWSVVTDVDISLLGLLFSGHGGSEFGGEGKGIYARGMWSF